MRYSNELFEKALARISYNRQQSVMSFNDRKAEIYIKIPQIKDIDKELSTMSLSVAKAILSKKTDINMLIEGLHQRSVTLEREKSDLLEKFNYPLDYLKEKYTCENCQDEGFVNGKRCICLENELKKYSFEQLNTVSPLKLSDFQSFDLSFYPDYSENIENESISRLTPRQKMERVFKASKLYADNFSGNSPSLLMRGNTGLGKTHLSLAIAGEVLNKGFGVVYNSCQNIMLKIESDYFSRAIDKNSDYLNAVLYCDLLILDDLGVEFQSNYTNSMLYNIINTRHNMSLPTIISTNLSSEEMVKKYTDRIASRIIASYDVFNFYGKDIRQLKLQNKALYKK